MERDSYCVTLHRQRRPAARAPVILLLPDLPAALPEPHKITRRFSFALGVKRDVDAAGPRERDGKLVVGVIKVGVGALEHFGFGARDDGGGGGAEGVSVGEEELEAFDDAAVGLLRVI